MERVYIPRVGRRTGRASRPLLRDSAFPKQSAPVCEADVPAVIAVALARFIRLNAYGPVCDVRPDTVSVYDPAGNNPTF